MKRKIMFKSQVTIVTCLMIALFLIAETCFAENMLLAKKTKKATSKDCVCTDCTCVDCKCDAKSNQGKVETHKSLKYGIIDTRSLESIINSKVPVVILDARTGKWDDGKRIPTAIQLSPDASEKEIENTIKSKDQLIITYCGGITCPASKKLADRLINLGYKNILEYPEGIKGWIDAGLPVENAK